MADNGSINSAGFWPMSQFHFSVNWDSTEMVFQEISGLDSEIQQIEYRQGNNPVFSTIKMPGMIKTGNITMKRGVFVSEDKFWDWYHKVEMNSMDRVPITIRLLDESHAPVMTWTLINAWPTKIKGADLQSSGQEVAIESIEIAHEGISIANA
jgi:phage tail-like protein